YLLGREVGAGLGVVGSRVVGMVSGLLLATSSAHTVITSHVPLSHSPTPLCATVTLWCLARAALRHNGAWIALAGLMAGLSLQTHPTVLPLLAGAALGVMLQRPAWLRTRWPYLALAGLLLGYSTLLLYHLQSRFVVVSDVQSKQERYLDADVDDGE